MKRLKRAGVTERLRMDAAGCFGSKRGREGWGVAGATFRATAMASSSLSMSPSLPGTVGTPAACATRPTHP